MRHPARQRRLLASLAEVGQQTPIVVVAAEGQKDRFVVIDGYKRIAALEQQGRDTGVDGRRRGHEGRGEPLGVGVPINAPSLTKCTKSPSGVSGRCVVIS